MLFAGARARERSGPPESAVQPRPDDVKFEVTQEAVSGVWSANKSGPGEVVTPKSTQRYAILQLLIGQMLLIELDLGPIKFLRGRFGIAFEGGQLRYK